MTLDHTLSLAQVLELFGLLQCVLILTVIVLKAADIRQAAPTVAFFAVLGMGFGLPAAVELRIDQWGTAAVWLVHALIPPVSYLLILQIATQRLPAARHLSVLALPLIGPPVALAAVVASGACGVGGACPEFVTFLRVFGVVPGALVLLLLWLHRGLFARLWTQRKARDRYWVGLTLIVFNVLNLWVDIPRATHVLGPAEWTFVHAVFGIAFVYLVTTLVFRTGHMPVGLLPGPASRALAELTSKQREVLERIKFVMARGKLYRKPTFSRADLARELDVTENVVSRVINGAYAKNFRRLLNDYRVGEAKLLLRRADMQATVIAYDVGFSSLNSFSRVFKEVTGQSPTDFRAAVMAAGEHGGGPGALAAGA